MSIYDVQVEFVPGEWVTVATVRDFYWRVRAEARRRWSTMNLRLRRRRAAR